MRRSKAEVQRAREPKGLKEKHEVRKILTHEHARRGAKRGHFRESERVRREGQRETPQGVPSLDRAEELKSER